MKEEKQPKALVISCRECDSSQTFEEPEEGKTLNVICRHCNSEIAKVSKDKQGKLRVDPEEVEVTPLDS